MALISCPECGKEISTKSEVCIHCGYPLKMFLKNRIFPTGTIIGYSCPKCKIDNMRFKVINSNSERTEACCTQCNTTLAICFDNIVLTQDEYNFIYDDIYDDDIDVAISKIMQITNCSHDTAKEYVVREMDSIHKMEEQLNTPHIKNRREKIEEQQKKYEQEKLLQEYQWRNNAECPYCHSKNTKKISGLSKAGSVALFGIFAMGKASKQWYCNNCKSDF